MAEELQLPPYPTQPPPPSYTDAMLGANTTSVQTQHLPEQLSNSIFNPPCRRNRRLLSQALCINPEELGTLHVELAESVDPICPGFFESGSKVAAQLIEVDTNLTKLSGELRKVGTDGDIIRELVHRLQQRYLRLLTHSGSVAWSLAHCIDRFDQLIVPMCQDQNVHYELKVSKIGQFIEKCTDVTTSAATVAQELATVKPEVSSIKSTFTERQRTKAKTTKQHQTPPAEPCSSRLRTTFDEILKDNSRLGERQRKSSNIGTGTQQIPVAPAWLLGISRVAALVAQAKASNSSFPQAMKQSTPVNASTVMGMHQSFVGEASESQPIEVQRQEVLKPHKELIQQIFGAIINGLDRHTELIGTSGEIILGNARSLQAVLEDKTGESQDDYSLSTVLLQFESGAYKSMSSYLKKYADKINSGFSCSS